MCDAKQVLNFFYSSTVSIYERHHLREIDERKYCCLLICLMRKQSKAKKFFESWNYILINLYIHHSHLYLIDVKTLRPKYVQYKWPNKSLKNISIALQIMSDSAMKSHVFRKMHSKIEKIKNKQNYWVFLPTQQKNQKKSIAERRSPITESKYS